MAETTQQTEESQQMTVTPEKATSDRLGQLLRDETCPKGLLYKVKNGPGTGKLFASLMGGLPVQFLVREDRPSSQPFTIEDLRIRSIEIGDEPGEDWIITGCTCDAGEDELNFEARYSTTTREGFMYIDYLRRR